MIISEQTDIIYEQFEGKSNQSTVKNSYFNQYRNKSELLFSSALKNPLPTPPHEIISQVMQLNSKSFHFPLNQFEEDNTNLQLNGIENIYNARLLTVNSNDSNDKMQLNIASPITTKFSKENIGNTCHIIVYNQSSSFSFSSQRSKREKVLYREIDNYFLSLYLTSNRKIPKRNLMGKPKLGCLYHLLYALSPKYTLLKELDNDRDSIIFLHRIHFNHKDDFHINILHTIYCSLFGNEDESNIKHINNNGIHQLEEMYNRLILHKEKPISLLSLAKISELIDKHSLFIKNNIKKFDQKQTEFNFFFVVMESITEITVEMIENGKLIPFFNQTQSVHEVTKKFICGLLQKAMNILDDVHQRRRSAELDDTLIEEIILKLRAFAFKAPSSVLWNFHFFIDHYPEENDSLLSCDNNNLFSRK